MNELHERLVREIWVRGESTDPRMAGIPDRFLALVTAARRVLDMGSGPTSQPW